MCDIFLGVTTQVERKQHTLGTWKRGLFFFFLIFVFYFNFCIYKHFKLSGKDNAREFDYKRIMQKELQVYALFVTGVSCTSLVSSLGVTVSVTKLG